MKRRMFACVSIPAIAAFIGILICICACFSTQVVAGNLPEALNSIPADYQFISGINVRRLVDNSLHSKLSKDQQAAGQMAGKLSSLGEGFGVEFLRDISYLVMAVRSSEISNPEVLRIVSGDFDRNNIIDFIRSRSDLMEMKYAGALVFLIPSKTNAYDKNAIVFLNEREFAFGNLELIQTALDTRAGKSKNILTNTEISSLIKDFSLDDTFWFAGNAASVFRQSPLPTPPSVRSISIQNLSGSFSIADNITGKIAAITADEEAASKLAVALNEIIAVKQLPPDLQILLSKMTVTQNTRQVCMSFDLPGDVLKRLGSPPILELRRPGQTVNSGNQSNENAPMPGGLHSMIIAPILTKMPKPRYTDEARHAGIEGVVLLQLVVRKDGSTDSFKVLNGLGYGLDQSAIDTIKDHWRFNPGTKDGRPVDVQIKVEVTFKLTKHE